jgi:hypothetical protein
MYMIIAMHPAGRYIELGKKDENVLRCISQLVREKHPVFDNFVNSPVK